jgi:hypothetical protein
MNDSLLLLEKIFLYNINTKLPSVIYDSDTCPICDKTFNNVIQNKKSYFRCGHVFCQSCTISSLKIKYSCPICRHIIKLNNIIIPSLIINKLIYTIKLINKIFDKPKYNNTHILIYNDNLLCAKGFASFLKNNIKYTYSILKNLSSNNKSDILICPKEKHFLCRTIKNIKNIIVLSHNQDITPDMLGHDYSILNYDVRLWLFNPICDVQQ